MGKQIAVIHLGDGNDFEIMEYLTRNTPHYVWFNDDFVEVYIG